MWNATARKRMPPRYKASDTGMTFSAGTLRSMQMILDRLKSEKKVCLSTIVSSLVGKKLHLKVGANAIFPRLIVQNGAPDPGIRDRVCRKRLHFLLWAY